jgi:hypothetical protein
MAGLRDNFSVSVENPDLAAFTDAAQAGGMGSLRRGLETGLIGNELNPLHTAALQAQIDGNTEAEAEARARIKALQLRQQAYAPEVGRVEDVHGLGDFGSFAAGQIGQGLASMTEPVAAGAALGTVGRVAGMIPGPIGQGVSAAAKLGGFAVPYMMSKNQLRGEQIGNQERDPALMARTTPQQRMDSADTYSTLAAFPDSAAPALIGRQFSGLSRAVGAAERKLAMGPAQKALATMTGEGLTEMGQSMGSQFALGQLNPERDTSGDAMENVNNFAGGMLGSSPLAGAGAYAEAGHNRVGAGVDRVKQAAGSVVDMANETGIPKKVADAASSATGSIRDLLADDEGEVTLGGVTSKVKDAVATYKRSKEDLAALHPTTIPKELDREKQVALLLKGDEKRAEVVTRTLTGMADDAEAQQHARAVASAASPDERVIAVEDAADFLITRHEQAEVKRDVSGWGQIAGAAAQGAGSVAATGLKGAAGLVKDFAKGVKKGLGSKKNMQNAGDYAIGDANVVQDGKTNSTDPYKAWQERTGFTQQNDTADAVAGDLPSAAKAKQLEAQERSRRRATMFGSKMSAAAKAAGHEDMVPAMRDMGFQIAGWAEMDKAMMKGDSPGMKVALNQIGNTMRVVFGHEAAAVIGEMERISDPSQGPLFQALKEELVSSGTPEGRELRQQLRSTAADRLLEMLPQKYFDEYTTDPDMKFELLRQVERMAAGGFPRQVREQMEATFGKPQVMRMISIVNGVADAVKPTVKKERGSASGLTPAATTSDDLEYRDEFEQEQADRKMSKSDSSTIFGFGSGLGLRSKTKDGGNVFDYTERVNAETRKAREADGEIGASRPALYKVDKDGVGEDKWDKPHQRSYGQTKLEARMQELRDTVGYKIGRDADGKPLMNPDGTRDDSMDESNGWHVESVPAFSVMNDHHYAPSQILQLYRDYLRQDALSKDDTMPAAKRTALSKKATAVGGVLGRLASRVENEAKDPKDWNGAESSDWQSRLLQAEAAGYKGDGSLKSINDFDQARLLKEAEAYFTERHVAVAKSTTDNDEQKMSVNTVLDLIAKGKARESRVRGDSSMAKDGEAAGQIASDANLLFFPKTTIERDGTKTTKHIPIVGSDLVYWAKSIAKKRGQSQDVDSEESGTPAKKNARYYEELMEGMRAFAGAHADGMPFKLNAMGEQESFADGVPPSLMLDNATYADALGQKGFRLTNHSVLDTNSGTKAKDPRKTASYQRKLQKEADKSDDYFTAEQREEREPEVDDRLQKSTGRSTLKTVVRQDLGGVNDTRRANGPIRIDRSGQVASEAKTSSMDATPIDFSKGQDPKAMADEITAQEYFTNHVNEKYVPPTNALHAMSSMKRNAEGLTATFLNSPQEGDREAVTMLRSALRPDGKATVGAKFDSYRIAPLVHLLSQNREETSKGVYAPKSNVEYFMQAGADHGLINVLRRGSAQVLVRELTSKSPTMSKDHAIALARVLAGNPTLAVARAVPALQNLINAEGGVVTDQDMHVRWDDPTTLPVIPKLKPQPVNQAPQGLAQVVKNKGDGILDLDEINNMTFAAAPAATKAKEGSFKGDDEAIRLARNRLKAEGALPLTAAEQETARKVRNATAASGVANAGLPKGQSGVALNAAGTYAAKDQAKSDSATKFIGQGSPASSTAKYAAAWGDRANSGNYTAADRVFISAEGNRTGRLSPDVVEINKATRAGATIITDDAANRAREYNIGERRVAYILKDAGYAETGPGVWTPVSKRNAQITQFPNRKGEVVREKAQNIMDDMSDEDLDTLQNDRLDSFKYPKMPSILKEYFNDWNSDYGQGEAGLSSDRIQETYAEYYQHIVDDPEGWDPEQVTMAQALLDGKAGPRANAQTPNGDHTMATAGQMAEARAWLEKAAPGTILNFVKESGWSGEYIDATNTVNVATTAAAGIMGTTYHEGLHKFFAQFVRSNPKLLNMFKRFANEDRVVARLHELLDGYPEAQAQLVDGEERLAYAFQFWKAGLLHVDNQNRSFFQKIGAFFRRVAGMVRDSEHALAIFQAFDQGKLAEPSVAGLVIAREMAKGTMNLKVRRKLDRLVQGLAAGVLPTEIILGQNQHSPTARKLNSILSTNPGAEGEGSKTPGYLNAKRQMGKKFANKTNQIFENMDRLDMSAVQQHMQAETDVADIKIKIHRDAVAALRANLDEFHAYMVESGLEIGKVQKNYYPVVWSVDALIRNKQEFIDMLVNKYAEQMTPDGGNAIAAANRIHAALIDRYGVDNNGMVAERADPNASKVATREDGVLSPFFAGQEGRVLPWLDGKDRERFLNKDMAHTLSSYFHQGVRAAEYRRRFGKDGIKLEAMLKRIRVEIGKASHKMLAEGEFDDEPARVSWEARQMRDISMSVGAIEGTLGKDISPNMRKFNSYMVAYQNVRLLPYMIYSSFVDPLAQVARGAPLNAALEILTTNLKAVFQSWGDTFRDMPAARVKDEWTKLAEHIGAVEVAMFNHHVAEEYSSVYMTPMAKKINDTLFKLNGMEAWDRSNRTMAVKWAVRFIEQHRSLPDRAHSARWLKELGLTPASIPVNADGNLITTADELAVVKGIEIAEAKRQIAVVHNALNRWVEGAVITPNAAQRPAWSSDPNYAAVFHLKQFSYSFQQTIMKRGMNEMNHGNLAPIGALALFVPTMIAADLMKGLVQGAGTLPPYLAGMDAGERIAYAFGRSGLTGPLDIGVDALEDWSSLGGPGFEQAIDALRDPIERTTVKALPLHAMGEYLVRGGTDVAVPV